MDRILNFLNNNPGLTAILGVIVGWILSSFTERKIYNRQKKDALEKERRERFINKAELSISKKPKSEEDATREIHVLLTNYSVSKDKNDGVTIRYPFDGKDFGEANKDIFYLENTGKSDINELEVAVADAKYTALLERNYVAKFSKEGAISYGVSYDRKMRKGEKIKLVLYWFDGLKISELSAPLVFFYRDSLNNICEQPFFPGDRNIYEPSSIDYSEWREETSVDRNIGHWERRLAIENKKKRPWS